MKVDWVSVAMQNQDVKLDSSRAGGTDQIKNSLKHELFVVIAGDDATDNDAVFVQLNLEFSNPSPGPLRNPARDRRFASN